MNKIPLGIWAPISSNFFGFLRASTMSLSCVITSSWPMMSSNVTFNQFYVVEVHFVEFFVRGEHFRFEDFGHHELVR